MGEFFKKEDTMEHGSPCLDFEIPLKCKRIGGIMMSLFYSESKLCENGAIEQTCNSTAQAPERDHLCAYCVIEKDVGTLMPVLMPVANQCSLECHNDEFRCKCSLT